MGIKMGILNWVAVDDFVSSSLLVTNQFDVTSNLISPAITISHLCQSLDGAPPATTIVSPVM